MAKVRFCRVKEHLSWFTVLHKGGWQLDTAATHRLFETLLHLVEDGL
jgi:hypothetical protein